MHLMLAALFLVPLAQAPAQAGSDAAPPGNPSAGASSFRPVGVRCGFCHGSNGEGAYGPAIAGGRGLTWEQFKHAVRKPYGMMPGFNEQQLPDQMLADILAFIKTLPPAPVQQNEWHWRRAPATAPLGQRLYVEFGCGQCHEPENKMPRAWMGERAKEVNYEYFAKMIYNHTDKYPKGSMPNFSRDRLPEIVLREIYKWSIEDIGMRGSVAADIAGGAPEGGNTAYTVTVTNKAAKDVGLDVAGLTLFIRVPKTAKVITGSGTGYKGVQPLASVGLEPALPLAPHAHDDTGHVERPKADLSSDVMVWKIPKVAAGEKAIVSFTLAGSPASDDELRSAVAGSTIHWETPGRRPSASPPMMVYRDLRIPDKGDHELVTFKGRR